MGLALPMSGIQITASSDRRSDLEMDCLPSRLNPVQVLGNSISVQIRTFVAFLRNNS